MNGQAAEPSIKEKGWKICREFLGGLWKKIPLEDFKISELSGGFSNRLYRCALPENAAGDFQGPREALLRIYGLIQEDPNVVVTEAVTFMLLSERKLGPKLYGLFPKGRLEEFIPSHYLNSAELRQYSALTAREMAKIHSLDVPVRKIPDMFQKYALKWLDELKDLLEKEKGKYCMSFDEYRKEIEWTEHEMQKSNSPVVYCHNDLQGGNVLYREDLGQNAKPNLILIDFEFGSYNYRGFDLANHFIEWCFDYNTTDYPHFHLDLNKFPTVQEQTEFFNAYIDQLLKEGVQLARPVKEEIEFMLNEITLFACASHLLWSLWSTKMSLSSSFEFSAEIDNRVNSEETLNGRTSSSNHRSAADSESGLTGAFKEYAKTRRKLYRKFKEQYTTKKEKVNSF